MKLNFVPQSIKILKSEWMQEPTVVLAFKVLI